MPDTDRSYPLSAATQYTAEVVASLGPGLVRRFTIPGIVAGRELNMAALHTAPTSLAPALVLASLVTTALASLAISASVTVFLLSQTW